MQDKGENPLFTQAIPELKSEYMPEISKELKKYKKNIASSYGSPKPNVKAPALLHQVAECQSDGEQTPHLPEPQLDLKSILCVSNEMQMLDFRMSIDKESAGLFDEKNVSFAAKRINCIRKDSSNTANSDNKKKLKGRKDITFGFTDSEDDESDKYTGISLHYSCKHCEYSDVNVDYVSAHYRSNHPYVIYNQVYLQDLSDLSATFRCLTCPVEFLTLSDLKAHNTENHPLSPNLFTLQSCDLSFKCFICAFTCSALEEVKTHYK